MRWQFLGVALLAVCLLVWGCGGSSSDGTGEPASTTSGVVSSTVVATDTTAVPEATASGVPDGAGRSGSVEMVSAKLALGDSHSCVLVGVGGVRCWGDNDRGQLGVSRVSGVVGSLDLSVFGVVDVVSVVAGGSHSCVLSGDGGVFCWGSNYSGQLGGGEASDYIVEPVRVVGVRDALAVAVGGQVLTGHSCVVHAGGGVSCWGNNASGRLGRGESEYLGDGDSRVDNFSVLSQRVLGISDAVDVAVSGTHSCVLRSGGLVSCWGEDTRVREDDVRLADSSGVPVEVMGLVGAVGVSVGSSFSCAVLGSGEVMCWGKNDYGQLGNGTTGSSFVPVRVLGIDDAVSVATGDWHACALHKSGEVSCWGDSSLGALGSVPEVLSYPFDFVSSVPVKVAGIASAIELQAGTGHTCVLIADGSVSCWGNNTFGQVGRVLSDGASQVVGIDDADKVFVSRHYSCALHDDGTISCWGNNNRGQLGNGTLQSTVFPEKVAGIHDATEIVTENFLGFQGYTCTLHDSGGISCWGANSFGTLGNGQSSGNDEDLSADSLVPVRVSGIGNAVDIDISWLHACAVQKNGEVSCWGSNIHGRLGNGKNSGDTYDTTGTSEDSAVPVGVVGLSDIREIELGGEFACALRSDGRVSCWGANERGQLGNSQNPPDKQNTETLSALPAEVIEISDAVSIDASIFSFCVFHLDTTLSCWGWNHRGELGIGSDEIHIDVPTKVTYITEVEYVVSSSDQTNASKCALVETGEVYCWGANTYGKLGSGEIQWSELDISSDVRRPTKVMGISNAISITAGSNHYCALISDGTVWCWGLNNRGQLGSSIIQQTASAEPLQVKNISDAVQINSAYDHTCAVIADGTIKCWGDNLFGQLGNGYAGYLPAKVPGLEVSG